MQQYPLIPVIQCGGAGSRLWPVSREMHAKPFIRLGDGQSLLQKSFLRGAQLPDVTEILTVTNRKLFVKTKDEYREVRLMPGACPPPSCSNPSAATRRRRSRRQRCMSR